MAGKKTQTATDTQQRRFRAALTVNQNNRDGDNSKDGKLVNCFVETLKNEATEVKKSYVIKRSGLTPIVSNTAGVGRGLAYFNGKYYSVIGDKLYENTTAIQTLGTSTGVVGFVPYDNASIQALFLCDGTDGYSISTGGVVTKVNVTYSTWAALTDYSVDDIRVPTVDTGFYYKVTADAGSSGAAEPTWPTTIGLTVVDAGITWECVGSYGGFPTPHIPTPIFTDGYLALAKANSSDIYNSDVDNIFGWSSANFVQAEMFPDNLLSLARQNNQIVAFGVSSTEFFYDAGTATGSPFQRNEGAVIQNGIAAPYAVYQNERFCIFVGQSDSGGRCVWLIEGFQPKRISTEYVEKLLDNEGTSLTSATGFGLRTQGHLFYIVNLTNISLVYDVEEKMWHEWSSNSSGAHTKFGCVAEADPGNGKASLLHATNGKIYSLRTSVYQDDSVDILTEIVTPKYDFETMERKFLHNINIIGDLQSGDIIQLRWSDDDYQTWSNFKTIVLNPRAYFTRLGSFRRRAFNLLHTGNFPLRLESLELEIDSGVN